VRAHLSRRQFLGGAAAGIAALAVPAARRPAAARAAIDESWDAGALAHLIPAVDHQQIRLKASFQRPLDAAPRLRVGARRVSGVRSDSGGRFWSFHADGLAPGVSHTLELSDARGRALCAPWSLRTFPPPDARPARFRLLVYTCGGGDGAIALADGTPYFVPLAERQRLLQRGLRFEPDALLAVGDHVYLDQITGVLRALRRGGAQARSHAGGLPVEPIIFDRAEPVLGGANEQRLQAAADPQIAQLYGARLRSLPSFLAQDDHDYFEDDRTSDDYVTFPPDPFMLALARATQRLYYPEFFVDAQQPRGLAGMGAGDLPQGLSECYGSIRFGALAELLVFDCRRHLSLKGPSAGFVPHQTEEWLARRLGARDVAHAVAVPSTPLGWSAGKWLEWYPDRLEPDGALATRTPKPYWQSGWLAQHDRLLSAAAQRPVPLFLGGDLHSLAVGRILRSGDLDLGRTPVNALLSGPLGTGEPGWPSGKGNRGVRGTPPAALDLEEALPCLEKNGFTLIDFARDSIELRMFAWRLGEPPDAINALEPVYHAKLEPRA
jgi:hypothetical protein